MRIMLSAGEASGDLHGAHLARELRRQAGDAVELSGMGGPLMAEAGVRLHYDPTRLSVVGFIEVIRHLGLMKRILRLLTEAMRRERIDVLVVIDLPTFNMQLAAAARRLGIPVVYYFSPTAWAWGRKRARRIAESGASVCAVLPVEAEVYREAGAHVVYVGHPLLDIVKVDPEPDEVRRRLGLDPSRPVVALLPGSRRQELERLVPVMREAWDRLKERRPELQAVLPLSHTVAREQLGEGWDQAGVRVVERRAHDALAASDAAIVASGTATLEAAIIGTPQVVVYRLSWLTYRLAKRLVRIRHIALPNIVAGREIVPELIQDDATGPNIADRVERLLDDAATREAVKQGYAEVVRRLGGPGAIARAAAAVLAIGRGEPVTSGLNTPLSEAEV